MTIINRLKRHAKMAWFIRVWYKLTMFFTQVKGHKLARYLWINQIPEALKFGDLYVPDPKALDVQYHPSKIQHWLDNGKPRHFDCLPQETLLLRNDGKFIPIKDIEIGNVIHDGSGWVKVLLKSEPSQKKILCFKLNNGSVLRCSPEHRVFLTNGKVVRAEDLKLEDRLLQPNEEFAGGNFSLTADEALIIRSSNKRTCAIVRDIVEEQEQTCYDIMTETSRIYLPESDVIVHNCDDHAIYWCTVIKKYNLARKVYIGFVYMVGADNKSMGHAVCVYEGWDGVVAWGDYGYPTPVKDVWEFANVAEDRYKAKKVSAALVEIRKVKGDCTPMYGKSSYKIYD